MFYARVVFNTRPNADNRMVYPNTIENAAFRNDRITHLAIQQLGAGQESWARINRVIGVEEVEFRDNARQVKIHLQSANPEYVLILSGDHLYQMDYRDFIRHHEETGADVSVSVIPCDEAHATGFGLLKTDDESRIVEFREKPPVDQLPAMQVDTTKLGLSPADAEQRPYIASMGVYLFKYEALRQLLSSPTPPIAGVGRIALPPPVARLSL